MHQKSHVNRAQSGPAGSSPAPVARLGMPSERGGEERGEGPRKKRRQRIDRTGRGENEMEGRGGMGRE